MAGKKNTYPLSQMPSASDFTDGLVSWPGPNRTLSKLAKGIIETGREQQLAEAVLSAKFRFAQIKIGELHEHGALVFDRTTDFIMGIKEQSGRSREHQAYIDHFTARKIALLDQHLLKLDDAGATAIAHQAYLPPYPEPEPERGFWDRVFGRK